MKWFVGIRSNMFILTSQVERKWHLDHKTTIIVNAGIIQDDRKSKCRVVHDLVLWDVDSQISGGTPIIREIIYKPQSDKNVTCLLTLKPVTWVEECK